MHPFAGIPETEQGPRTPLPLPNFYAHHWIKPRLVTEKPRLENALGIDVPAQPSWFMLTNPLKRRSKEYPNHRKFPKHFKMFQKISTTLGCMTCETAGLLFSIPDFKAYPTAQQPGSSQPCKATFHTPGDCTMRGNIRGLRHCDKSA